MNRERQNSSISLQVTLYCLIRKDLISNYLYNVKVDDSFYMEYWNYY